MKANTQKQKPLQNSKQKETNYNENVTPQNESR